MPLVAIDNFIDLLACPQCGGKLTGPPARLVCSQRSCDHRYQAVGDPPKPVLIAPDASIMDVAAIIASGGSSPVERGYGGRLLTFLTHRFAEPTNTTAERYVRHLAEDLVAET